MTIITNLLWYRAPIHHREQGKDVPQQETEQTEHVCPNCQNGLLEKVKTKAPDGSLKRFLWRCSNISECAYSTQDHNNKPLGKFACQRCGEPLRFVTELDKPYWICTDYFAATPCKTTYEDNDSEPVYP